MKENGQDDIMTYDKDIREPLFDFLEERFGKIRIIEEKMMGHSRADVVMVTEPALYGIEIKSDADTYARLGRQTKDYDKYYDYNLVVAGTSHAMHIEKHVPEYWGIITVENVDGVFDFYMLRHPKPNPKVSWSKKLEILWRPELSTLQEWNKMPRYQGKSKAFVIEKIAKGVPEKIPPELLAGQVGRLLFERDYNTIAERIEEYRRGKRRG